MVPLSELAAKFAAGLGLNFVMHPRGHDARIPLCCRFHNGPYLLLPLGAFVDATGQKRSEQQVIRRKLLVGHHLMLISRKAEVRHPQAQMPQTGDEVPEARRGHRVHAGDCRRISTAMVPWPSITCASLYGETYSRPDSCACFRAACSAAKSRLS